MKATWPEAEDLITATFGQPIEQRERFVLEHCADPGLREALATLVRTGSAAAPPGSPSRADLAAGTKVGPYVILRRLGQGGMGEVFLGRDPRLDRLVALKCLFGSPFGADAVRARIIHEARAAARVSHAHVAAVHDVLEHDGRAFIVMEYVEGENLAVLLKRESLAPDKVVTIGRQIAGALAAAHARGIVHRDLKPANVQVTPDGAIKILDFGIATALAAVGSTTVTGGDATATATEIRGPLPGTPAYMSPEQLLGRTVDERSDIFSLGVILFEMATRRRPFSSTNPLEMLLAAVRKLPRADSLDARVPGALADVIARALEADPSDRYQSAGEIGAALEAVSRGIETTSPSAVPAVQGRRAAAKARNIALLSGAVPVVLWGFGRLTSVAYNSEMGRFGPFVTDTTLDYFVLGARSLVAPAFYAAAAATVWWSASFLLRIVALVAPVARTFDSLTTRWINASARLKLNDPIVMAQALTTAGAVAVAVVLWSFAPLISAWATDLTTAPENVLRRLGASNEHQKLMYRATLTLLFLIFVTGLVHVLGLRRRLGTKGGKGPVVALAIVVVVLLVLNELPYRVMWRSSAVRADFDGARCYVIGDDSIRALLFCPDLPPPRAKVVSKADPRFRSHGVVEKIFNAR